MLKRTSRNYGSTGGMLMAKGVGISGSREDKRKRAEAFFNSIQPGNTVSISKGELSFSLTVEATTKEHGTLTLYGHFNAMYHARMEYDIQGDEDSLDVINVTSF